MLYPPRGILCGFLLQVTCLPVVFSQTCVPAKIERVAVAISVHEGWNNPNSLVRRQHNPGALIFVGQPGGRKGRQGYAWFKTDQTGKQALVADLRAKSARGMTLAGIMDRWSVTSYGRLVARETGVGESEVLANDCERGAGARFPDFTGRPVSPAPFRFHFSYR